MGDCYAFTLLHFVVVVVNDPACVQHILRDNFANYEKAQYIFMDLLGDGIFNSDGPVWNVHRKVWAADLLYSKRTRGGVRE